MDNRSHVSDHAGACGYVNGEISLSHLLSLAYHDDNDQALDSLQQKLVQLHTGCFSLPVKLGIRFDSMRLETQDAMEIEERMINHEDQFIDMSHGYNIFLADDVFLNYGCVLLDVCPIRIGAKTQIGPGVQLYAADHPREAKDREAGYESGSPITIGKNVWIGGHAIVLPGITIGDNAVVGADSVVTRDVLANVTIVGNPAAPTR